MTRAEDVDAALKWADHYVQWGPRSADERCLVLLAEEVVRLRDLQRAAIAYQGPLADEVERLRAENARLREFETFLRDQAREFGPSASLAASLAEWDGTVLVTRTEDVDAAIARQNRNDPLSRASRVLAKRTSQRDAFATEVKRLREREAVVWDEGRSAGERYERQMWQWQAGPISRNVNGLTVRPERDPNPYTRPQ